MSKQLTDRMVLTEAARKAAKTRELRHGLRVMGIRDPHTSRKARAAARRAAGKGSGR